MIYSLNEMQSALEGTGRRVKRSGGNLVTNCLAHAEKNPSMQVFPDGWCACLAGCGRFHISHYFDEFKDPDWKPDRVEYKSEHKSQYKSNQPLMAKPIAPVNNEEKDTAQYREYDLFPIWNTLKPLDRDFDFKGLPIGVLDDLGWRWSDGVEGMGRGILIPYFNHTRNKIPFAQVRHLEGGRRFTMLPGAKMTTYGKWNLYDGEKVFLVEGPSDGAVLEACMVPWLAIPSAACGPLAVGVAKYCLKRGITLIYAGDNDEPGEKLKEAIDEVAPYRVCQPPLKYKDWGDYYEAEGLEVVAAYLNKEYMEPDIVPMKALAGEVFPKPAYVPPSKRPTS